LPAPSGAPPTRPSPGPGTTTAAPARPHPAADPALRAGDVAQREVLPARAAYASEDGESNWPNGFDTDQVVTVVTRGNSEARSVLAAGTVRLDELGQHFNIELEHEEVDSVSGLVLARLDRPPVVGDVVAYGRIRLAVTAITGHGVREVRATLLPVESDT